jgi:hypothetical protein
MTWQQCMPADYGVGAAAILKFSFPTGEEHVKYRVFLFLSNSVNIIWNQ